MQTNKSTLYVVVVTYNGAEWMDRCLGSVFQSSYPAKVIVIDNGSCDDTVKIVRDRFPRCQLVETQKNLGFGRANNIGIKMAIDAGADYIYLLNQDAWVSPDVFEILIDSHKHHPEYGILSPVQMTGEGNRLDKSFEHNAVCERRCPDFIDDYINNRLKDDPYQTLFVMAAHWLLYTEDLKRIGTFSPAFPHYGEDSNLVQRYRYWGKKIGVCGRAVAYHDRLDRSLTASKELYMRYIVYITLMNNPLCCSWRNRVAGAVVFILRSLKLGGVSLSNKLSSIKRGLSEGHRAAVYRKQYKIEYNNLYTAD